MSIQERASLIIYRFAAKGLEIFMVKDEQDQVREWKLPEGRLESARAHEWESEERLIELEPLTGEDGNQVKAVAVEGDWHDLPSIHNLVREDVSYVKDKIRRMMPDADKGAFFALKEAFKKVMPNEYAVLKELKDVLLDRNSTKHL